MSMPKMTVDRLINTLVHLRGAYTLHKNNAGNLTVHDPSHDGEFLGYRGFIDLMTGEYVPYDEAAEVKGQDEDHAQRCAEEDYP